MARHLHLRAYFFLGLAVFLWGLVPLVIKYLAQAGFSSHAMNCYRYTAALLVILLIVAVRYRRALAWSWGLFWGLVALTIPNITYQFCYVEGLQVLAPGFTSLLVQLLVPFSVVLAWIFCREERAHIRSGKFIAGGLLSLAGAIGIIAFQRTFTFEIIKADITQTAGPSLVMYSIAMIILAALGWAIYTVAMRQLLRSQHPVICFSGVAVLSTLIFWPMAWADGGLGRVFQVSWKVNFVLMISGVVFIAAAQVFYFESIRILGVSRPSIILLICPLISAICSYFVFQEVLAPGQWLAGGTLIMGAGLCVVSRNTNQTPIEAVPSIEPAGQSDGNVAQQMKSLPDQ